MARRSSIFSSALRDALAIDQRLVQPRGVTRCQQPLRHGVNLVLHSATKAIADYNKRIGG